MGLVAVLGWRGAYLALGAALLVFVVPLTAVLMRNDPSERGLLAYGATAATPVMTAAQEAAERTPVSEAVRTWPFLLLCGSFWVCGYSTFGVILAHFIPHATDHGFQAHQAAEALGIMGAMNIVGTIASGWLCDRLGPKVPLALYYLFRGISLFFLPYVTTVPGPLPLRGAVRAQLHLDGAGDHHADRAHLRALLGRRAVGLDLRLASARGGHRLDRVRVALRQERRLHAGVLRRGRVGPARDRDGALHPRRAHRAEQAAVSLEVPTVAAS
jgi:hypothetical protein